MTEWSFAAATEDYEAKGLNDSGIETFNDDCLKGLAREICQNSLDARAKNVEENQPVIVEFSRFNSVPDQFPGKETFFEALERSRAFWKNRNDEKTVKFFKDAIDATSELTIPWLRVSDFYTTGLSGVSKGNARNATTPWSSLVMSSGVSNKAGGSGGSFGIGKFASFSCSRFRTCFYSTVTDEGEKGFQGVARLVSFENKENHITLGNGYYRDGGQPLKEPLPIDKTFNRDVKSGTDIFIPAFCGEDAWFEDITASVLDGFLFAIFKNKLEVHLLDEGVEPRVINREWLDNQYRLGQLANRPTVKYNYEVLKNDDPNQSFRKDIGKDGYLELRLMLAPELDRRISMIRETGMKIYAKGNFPASISFSGVLVVHGEDLNKRIKKFENPQHTKWEPKRNPSDSALLDEINRFCRKSLDSLVEKSAAEELDAGLGDVLPAVGESDKQEERETLSAKINSLTENKRKKRRSVTKMKTQETGEAEELDDEVEEETPGSGGGPGENDGVRSGTEGHDGDDAGYGNGPSEDGNHKQPKLRLVKSGMSRFACTDEALGEYRMFVVPEVSETNGVLAVNAVAELNTYEASIVSAKSKNGSLLKVEGNKITGLNFKKGELMQISLKLDYSDYVSLEVEWYGTV